MRMHARIMKRVKGVPIDLLFIGDSLTEHWLEEGRSVWKREFGVWNPGNFGLSGDTTYGVQFRLKQNELAGLHPKVVVILIGTNDLSMGREPDDTAKGIKKIVEMIKEQLPDTNVVLLGLLPRSYAADPIRKQLTLVNNQIAGFDNGKDVHYVDLSKIFVDSKGEMIPDLTIDKLHLSEKGYQCFAEALKPIISQYLAL